MLRRILPILLLLLAPALLPAQAPADLRISPSDTEPRTMPWVYRIESSARIGAGRLVVREMTINAPDGSIIGALRGEIIRSIVLRSGGAGANGTMVVVR